MSVTVDLDGGVLPVVNGGTGQSSYTNGQLLIGNSSGSLSKNTLTAGAGISITNGNGLITIATDTKYWLIRHLITSGSEEGPGIDPGAFFVIRGINTMSVDSGSEVTLDNVNMLITFTPGKYVILWSVPGFQCGSHRSSLYSETDNGTLAWGSTEYAGTNCMSRSVGSFLLTAVTNTTVSVRHRIETNITNGYGKASNFGIPEVYTVVEIWKID